MGSGSEVDYEDIVGVSFVVVVVVVVVLLLLLLLRGGVDAAVVGR